MEIISNLIEQELRISSNFTRPLQHYRGLSIETLDDIAIQSYLWNSTHNLFKYYRTAFGWIKADPSEPDTVSAIKHFYIWQPKTPKTSSKYVNVKGNYRFFKEAVSFFGDSVRKDIYLTGEKGVGKTFFLNFFLNRMTYYLRKKSIMWYRVDASQVYANDLDLWSYFYLQVIYVSLKFINSVDHLKDIYNEDNRFLKHLKNNPYPNRIKEENALHILRKYLSVMKSEKAEGREPYKKMYAHAFSGTKDPIIKFEIEFLGRSILSYLRNNHVNLLFIFDGIDNINYITGRNKYMSFLEQMKHFGLGVHKTKLHEAKLLVVCRNETYAHFRNDVATYGDHYQFSISPLDIDSICSDKVSKVIDCSLSNYKNVRDKAACEIDKAKGLNEEGKSIGWFDLSLSRFAKSFSMQIQNELRRSTKLDSYLIDNILLSLYNSNVRAFTYNMLNAWDYKLLFEETKKIRGRSYVVLEGMLLDGKLFFDSKHTMEASADFINPFYYDSTDQDKQWHGLCGMRLFNLLSIAGPYTKERIRLILNSWFGYHPLIIEQFFQRFVEAGLVVPNLRREEVTIRYSITSKGLLFMNMPFLNVDFLYFFALDTPLSAYIVSDSRMIALHSKFWENYTEAAVKTTMTMIRHIKSQIKLERNYIDQHWDDKEIELDLGITMFYDYLPNFDRIIGQIIAMINKLPEERKEALMLDLEGLMHD